MDVVLYEKPRRIELVGTELLVDGEKHPKSVRTLGQMRVVMQEFHEEAADVELYYMYRDVYHQGDLRFDITIIPQKVLGGEYAKTKGHYHPGSEDGSAYPEIYQVLRGKAEFILQKKNRNGSVDSMLIDAKEGDVVLIPPNYGHVTVNKGEATLVMSNLVYSGFDSLYQEYAENKGAAFYYMEGGQIKQNTNYIVHLNEQISPEKLNKRYEFSCDDILNEFVLDPKKFEFLKKPSLIAKD